MPTPLIGRGKELAGIERALLRARTHGLQLVEVYGEPGIGKSRLLDEGADRARRHGMQVISGQAAESKRDLPFGVIVDALDDYRTHLADDAARWLGPERSRLLDMVLPGLSRPSQPTANLAGAEVHRMSRLILKLLESMSEPLGSALILDDLHQADEASIELLNQVISHPPRAALAIVVAYRPRQASARLSSVLARSAHAGRETRVEVGPLPPAAMAELLGSLVNPSSRAKVSELSGGNPFYLAALAHANVHSVEETGHRHLLITHIPRAASSILLDELRGLRPEAHIVAQAAAVAGEPFDPELVADVAGIAEASVLAPLDELERHDVIRVSGFREFIFRHPLLRSVVYAKSGSGWLLAAHARAAKTLARRGACLSLQAHHTERSAQIGDAEAVALLTKASDSILTDTPIMAMRWLTAAKRLTVDIPALRPAFADAQLLMARALGARGELADCNKILRTILRDFDAGTERRVETALRYARMERIRGNRAVASALLETELRYFSRAGVHRAAGEIELAYLAMLDGDFTTARQRSENVCRHWYEHDEVRIAASCLIGLIHVLSGNIAEALVEVDKAARVVDDLPDAELAGNLDALNWLARAETFLERHENALRHVERAIELARRSGQGYLLPDLLILQARLYQWLDRPHEVSRAAAYAFEIAHATSNDELCVAAHMVVTANAAGDEGPDRPFGADSHSIDVDRTALRRYAASTAMLRAHRLLRAGEIRGAHALLAHDHPHSAELDAIARFDRMTLMVRAELDDTHSTEDHRLDVVAQAVRTAVTQSRTIGSDGTRARPYGQPIERPRLSPREREVLTCYASGMTLQGVSRMLGIRPTTVKTYLERIKEKYLEAGRPTYTKVDLAARAREDGVFAG